MFLRARAAALLALTLVLLSLAALAAGCGNELKPVTAPTLPATIPEYAEVDPATGLHMTGTPTVIDLNTYRLKVGGKVDHPLELTYDELRSMEKVTASPTLVCPGLFEDVAAWSGAPLMAVLDKAGVQAGAKDIQMKDADGYAVYVPLQEALRPENFLAYELSEEPLPVLHGFPLRAVLPGQSGNRWVKWLLEIDVQ
jgi:DMSO/TMAO reductase YedYZ molybdopterin-dependent catalytic subunit